VVRDVHVLGAGEFLHIVYADQTEFVVSADGRRVYGAWVAPLTLADTLTYALGPITAICLRRLGRVCLHGSAVAWGDGAVLFVGCAGAGKSTTAAALVRRGAAALTDDVAVFDLSGETPAVHPGHAWYRLWPDSVRLVCGSESALPLLTPNWEKRYLDATQHLAGAEPVPVRSVFFLEQRTEAGPRSLITRLSPRESFLHFQANTLGAPFVDAPGRAHEFRVLSELARTIPCSVIDHTRWSRPVNELLDAIEQDMGCHALI
jgi:hypothetical protein